MCTTKKKERINKTIRQIEENHKRNELRKFLSEIKHLRQQNTGFPHICKDENNTVINQTDKILNRYKEYFSTILNSDLDELSSNYRTQITTTDIRMNREILSP
jgi:uncharacterized coiled-coil DUF342 family protein